MGVDAFIRSARLHGKVETFVYSLLLIVTRHHVLGDRNLRWPHDGTHVQDSGFGGYGREDILSSSILIVLLVSFHIPLLFMGMGMDDSAPMERRTDFREAVCMRYSNHINVVLRIVHP